jgi:hypothetical protein
VESSAPSRPTRTGQITLRSAKVAPGSEVMVNAVDSRVSPLRR